MKILIKANDEEIAKRVKDTFESFGKGMHIYTKDDGFSYYACVVCVGDVYVFQEPELLGKFAEPLTEDEWTGLEKELWTFYRDNIKDNFANKCSCGLFEFCHCH